MEGFPIWINLYALPLEFWDFEALSKIGAVIGLFMYLDYRTIESIETWYNRSKARMAVWMRTSRS